MAPPPEKPRGKPAENQNKTKEALLGLSLGNPNIIKKAITIGKFEYTVTEAHSLQYFLMLFCLKKIPGIDRINADKLANAIFKSLQERNPKIEKATEGQTIKIENGQIEISNSDKSIAINKIALLADSSTPSTTPVAPPVAPKVEAPPPPPKVIEPPKPTPPVEKPPKIIPPVKPPSPPVRPPKVETPPPPPPKAPEKPPLPVSPTTPEKTETPPEKPLPIHPENYQKMLAGHPERMPNALDALNKAKAQLQEVYKKLQALPAKSSLQKEGEAMLANTLKDPDFNRYLPLMLKESSLDPKEISSSGAKGLFQVKLASTGPDLQKFYNYTTTNTEIDDPAKNCVAGILYFEIVRQHYVGKHYPKHNPEDLELLTLASYNAGSPTINAFWDSFLVTNYKNLELALSLKLTEKIGTELKGKSFIDTIDEGTGVTYRQYRGVDHFLAPKKYGVAAKLEDPLFQFQVIDGNGKKKTVTIKTSKFGEVLRYARVIEGIKKLGQQPVIPGAAPAEKKPLPLVPHPPPYSAEEQEQARQTILEDLKKAWGTFKDEINSIKKPADKAKSPKKAPALPIDPDKIGKEYGAKLKKEVDALAKTIDVKNPHLYKTLSNETYEENEKIGNKILTNKYGLNLMAIPAYPGMKVQYKQWDHPKRKIRHEIPVDRRKETTHIVLHSSEAGAETTADGRQEHFVVDKKGQIYAVIFRDGAINHAGYEEEDDPGFRGKWNGDGNISYHSIGIEVETIPGKGEEWNDAQCEAVKKLVHALGAEYKIPAKNVITHSQVGYSHRGKFGSRYRKFDPMNVNWLKLDLPNNYRLVDIDEAKGDVIQSDIGQIPRDALRDGQALANNLDGKLRPMIEGTLYSAATRQALGEIPQKAKNLYVKTLEAKANLWEAQRIKTEKAEKEQEGSENKPIIDSQMDLKKALEGVSKDCPEKIKENLKLIPVKYYSFDNKVHQGQLLIHKDLVSDIQKVFQVAFENKFPIQSVIPMADPKFKWVDETSMQANNSSGFNYRDLPGGETLSYHAKGMAFDLNPKLNPYIKDAIVLPKGAKHDQTKQGVLIPNNPIVKKFIELGWSWGGNWTKPKDYQHFEKNLEKKVTPTKPAKKTRSKK